MKGTMLTITITIVLKKFIKANKNEFFICNHNVLEKAAITGKI